MTNQLLHVLTPIKEGALTGKALNVTDFPDASLLLRKMGISLEHVLESLPHNGTTPSAGGVSEIAQGLLQVFLVAFGVSSLTLYTPLLSEADLV